MNREKFSSRLGFILISAGCAIGLGNVWRFPYITGKYGGAAFVLFYIFFLLILGMPIMVAELAVGRASQKSLAKSFDTLEPKGSKWHVYKWFGIAGNYLLMMFYTTIAGWMLYYMVKMAAGKFNGLNAEEIGTAFGAMTQNPGVMTLFMVIVVVLCFGVCAMGLQKGVERITKVMMMLFCAKMLLTHCGSCASTSGTLPMPTPSPSDRAMISPARSSIGSLANDWMPLTRIIANMMTAAPPSTDCGMTENSALSFGQKPHSSKNTAPVMMTKRLTILLTTTRPTF